MYESIHFGFKNMFLYQCVRVFIAFSILLVACKLQANTVQEPDNRWESSSKKGRFNVTISPQQPPIPIGRFHQWVITVKDKKMKPVSGAEIQIGGGMEQHGHGLPSQPLVTRYLGDGDYLAEGMLFNMSGEWTVLLEIKTPKRKDKVVFTIDLAF